MKRVPIGIDNFKDIIEENYYFVDKTVAMEHLLEKGNSVTLFPRPRRFGKSLFISILENFFDIDKKTENEHLFDGLKIKESEYYQEFGMYPVIHLDFKDLKKESFLLTYREFQNIISDVYETKKYLLNELDEIQAKIFNSIKDKTADRADYERSIKYLSHWLEKYHHKKTIILIDEYDVPIQTGYIKGFYDQVMDLIRSVLSSSLKGNDSLKFGVMTGVLRVSKESIFSDLNNLDVCDLMTKEYNDTFGFTENETKALLEYYGLELTSEVKDYYDGYNFSGVSIYNPWSILNYASKKVLQPYWVNSSGNGLIIELLNKTNEENKIEIEKLVQGESSRFRYNDKLTYLDFERERDIGSILNLMYASGYLTLDKIIEEDLGNEVYVRIPNHEVKEIIVRIISYAFMDNGSLIERNVYDFNKSILNNNKEDMETNLNKLLLNISYIDIHENFYHGYMLGIFGAMLNSHFIVKQTREAGMGRYDVLIEKEDKSFGCIFEFKVTDKESEMENLANIANEQMKEKEYYKELVLDKVQNIKEYVIVFCGKKCIVR